MENHKTFLINTYTMQTMEFVQNVFAYSDSLRHVEEKRRKKKRRIIRDVLMSGARAFIARCELAPSVRWDVEWRNKRRETNALRRNWTGFAVKINGHAADKCIGWLLSNIHHSPLYNSTYILDIARLQPGCHTFLLDNTFSSCINWDSDITISRSKVCFGISLINCIFHYRTKKNEQR